MAGNGFVKHIGVGQGIALYVSAILGAGVLVLPGQVASMAGPASLVSWAIASLLGVPLAVMFAALARRFPDAGGVASYARAGFGPTAGGITGWLFFVAGSVGQTIVPLTGGYYVADACDLGGGAAIGVAVLILLVATGANLLGVRVSARTQLWLAGSVGLALALIIAVTVPRMRLEELTPFAPQGVAPIGSAVVVLFFAFAGWEAISHLVGEFRDPDRDVPRAVAATVVIVSVLYLGTACAVVLTGTYGDPATDRVAIGILLQEALGAAAGPVAAVIAVVISLGTTNAFIAGVSRLGHSLAADRWLPTPIATINRNGVPVGGVLAVSGIAAAGLAIAAWRDWGTDTLVVIPSTLVVAVYVIAAAAAVRVLTGGGRVAAISTLVITVLVVPTAAQHALIPVAVVVLALLSRLLSRSLSNPSNKKQTSPHST
ncbi:amino acid permease [Nakamurella sp. A5-74]|uniref:Amino acid permease n=1 Tax=Nakamurella sp. A5-74 TaxID=3158264 RepID=A0AAU8DPW0_9ACTN